MTPIVVEYKGYRTSPPKWGHTHTHTHTHDYEFCGVAVLFGGVAELLGGCWEGRDGAALDHNNRLVFANFQHSPQNCLEIPCWHKSNQFLEKRLPNDVNK
eukprot:GHVR01094852.1.p1 GENE.GHVR01094852.1~~GHVR01094852.1.p1  ORF type:complete len:117 (-),score=56.07 GHVR01094852.1:293-592(-)